MKKTIKAWAVIREDTGLMDSFSDLRATFGEAQLVANHNRAYNQKGYYIVPVEITFTPTKK